MIFKFASIQRFCAPAVCQKNRASFHSHATGHRPQPIAAGTAKVLDGSLRRGRMHTGTSILQRVALSVAGASRTTCQGVTRWQQFGLILAVYQMNRAGI